MKNEQANKITEKKSDFLKKFEMSESDDLHDEEHDHDDHVHVEGCCSCHSNTGK